MKLVIDGKGKISYLTGEVTKPAEKDTKFKTWRSENSMIITWLINLMEPALGKPFMFLLSTKDVWDIIRETYLDLENWSQIFELKTKLWQSKQGD